MPGSVLIVDQDQAVSGLVTEFLASEGFSVSELVDREPFSIEQEVARLEPDVVLLAGRDGMGYGPAWTEAAWLHERDRPIAVIMFTAYSSDLDEAQRRESERSRRAAFQGFVAKPFDLEELFDTVDEVLRAQTARQCRLVRRTRHSLSPAR
jgi:DNA-binding response OmpR family regulator